MRHRHAVSPGDRLGPTAPASATSRSSATASASAFAGNSHTSRETVERYLLFRAAELTLQTGNDYFIMVDRDTDKQTRTYTTPAALAAASAGPYGGYSGFGYWGPSWRYYGRGFGWRGWNAFFGDPFWDRASISAPSSDTRRWPRSSSASGRKPADNVRAFDAREVVDRLGPTIQVPEAAALSCRDS